MDGVNQDYEYLKRILSQEKLDGIEAFVEESASRFTEAYKKVHPDVSGEDDECNRIAIAYLKGMVMHFMAEFYKDYIERHGAESLDNINIRLEMGQKESLESMLLRIRHKDN